MESAVYNAVEDLPEKEPSIKSDVSECFSQQVNEGADTSVGTECPLKKPDTKDSEQPTTTQAEGDEVPTRECCLKRPEACSLKRPEACSLKQPEACSLKRPEACSLKQPEACSLKRPEACSLKRPEACSPQKSEAQKEENTESPEGEAAAALPQEAQTKVKDTFICDCIRDFCRSPTTWRIIKGLLFVVVTLKLYQSLDTIEEFITSRGIDYSSLKELFTSD